MLTLSSEQYHPEIGRIFLDGITSLLPPHLPRHTRHQFQFAALVFKREVVAFHGGGEAALGAEGETFKGDDTGGFGDALT